MQNIQESWQKIKGLIDAAVGEWGLLAIMMLASLGSFGLGRLSALVSARPPISLTEAAMTASAAPIARGGLVVASRTGAVYYYPWCAGASKVAATNQRWFATEKAPQNASYRAAKNCKGMQ